MQMIRTMALITAWLASARLVLAHTGHGSEQGAAYLLHYLVEPVHIIPVALVTLGALLVVRYRRMRAVRSRG